MAQRAKDPSPSRPDRPFVTLAWAQSLDGCIGRKDGGRLALSGPESSRMTHCLRAAHGAILVGIGTILADDPRLTVRLASGPNPRPLVLDPTLRTPPSSRLVERDVQKPWIFASMNPPAGKEGHNPDYEARCEALERLGCRIIPVGSNQAGRLNLHEALAYLARQGIETLMVEGGAKILAAFVSERLADRVNVTVAPILVGGLNPFEGHAFAPAINLKGTSWKTYGRDTVMEGIPDWEGEG